MSDKITLEQFKEKMQPIDAEAHKLNKRLGELQEEFEKLANAVEPADDDEEDDFADTMFEYAGLFISNIDYEYSAVEPGNVNIWEQSTC